MAYKAKQSILIVFLSITFFSINGYSLVDYSDSSSEDSRFEPSPSKRQNTSVKRVQGQKRSSGYSKMIDLDLLYGSQKIESDEVQGKVETMGLRGSLRTHYNIFMEFSYFQAKSDDKNLSEKSSYQEGNPEVLLGFNWLKLGQNEQAANIDILLGGSFRSSSSDFAHTRNDKIVELMTTKKIAQFVLGVGVRYTLTGQPKDEEELKTGNIRKIGFALGWLATPDIRFSAEANAYNISSTSSDEHTNNLDSSVSFSTLKARLDLLLRANYSLFLGGVFNTRSPHSDQNLVSAKLYTIEGLYGNSIFTGLSFGI